MEGRRGENKMLNGTFFFLSFVSLLLSYVLFVFISLSDMNNMRWGRWEKVIFQRKNYYHDDEKILLSVCYITVLLEETLE